MVKTTRVKNHMPLKNIMEKIRKSTNADQRMRWQIVYTVAVDPRDSRIIAKQLGCSRRTVSGAVSEYNQQGKSSFQGKGSGSNRSNFYFTKEEESNFLKPFVSRARRGLITTSTEIKIALEKRLKKSIPKSTVCRMLSRHGWRKITSRPFHPLSNQEKQDEFKKNFPCWYPILQGKCPLPSGNTLFKTNLDLGE